MHVTQALVAQTWSYSAINCGVSVSSFVCASINVCHVMETQSTATLSLLHRVGKYGGFQIKLLAVLTSVLEENKWSA